MLIKQMPYLFFFNQSNYDRTSEARMHATRTVSYEALA